MRIIPYNVLDMNIPAAAIKRITVFPIFFFFVIRTKAKARKEFIKSISREIKSVPNSEAD